MWTGFVSPGSWTGVRTRGTCSPRFFPPAQLLLQQPPAVPAPSSPPDSTQPRRIAPQPPCGPGTTDKRTGRSSPADAKALRSEYFGSLRHCQKSSATGPGSLGRRPRWTALALESLACGSKEMCVLPGPQGRCSVPVVEAQAHCSVA